MRNIIFDVDGTLWDTTEVIAEAWNRAIAKVCGTSAVMTTSSVLKKEFGKTMDVIVADLFGDLDKITRERLLKVCLEYEQDALRENTANLLFPEVKETLIKLSKQCRLFIVSNCQCGYIELFMEKAGIEKYIADYECFGNTGKTKGENIRLVVERNHLQDVVYVGDTQGDYEATVLAGVPFIYAEYGFGNVESCDRAIGGITELLDFLRRI